MSGSGGFARNSRQSLLGQSAPGGMDAVNQYNQFRQQGQQYVDQNYSPGLLNQFRQVQDAGYKQMQQQVGPQDQSTYQGFLTTNAARAARPETNAAGWNDVARARSRSQAFSQMTPEQWAERQRLLASYNRS